MLIALGVIAVIGWLAWELQRAPKGWVPGGPWRGDLGVAMNAARDRKRQTASGKLRAWK